MTRTTPPPRTLALTPRIQQSPRARPVAARAARSPVQEGLCDGLRLVQRGTQDAAITAGVLGGLASLVVPGLREGVLATVGVSSAASVAATVAQAAQAAFAPELYMTFDDHVRRARSLWDKGAKQQAMRHMEFAAARTPAWHRRSLSHYLEDRHVEGMAGQALEPRSRAVLLLLAKDLPQGRRVWLDMILAAHRHGVARDAPLRQWTQNLTVRVAAALPAEGLAGGIDALMEQALELNALDVWQGRTVSQGVLACVGGAQAGHFGTPTRHRLARLFVAIPQLSTRGMLVLAGRAEAPRQALFALDDMDRAGALSAGQRGAVYALLDAAVVDGAADAGLLGQVHALAAGTLSLPAFTLALAEKGVATEATVAALAGRALAQFVGGDTRGALALLRQLECGHSSDGGRMRAVKRVLAGTPQATHQLFLAALEAGDDKALERLMPVASEAPLPLRLRSLDALAAKRWETESQASHWSDRRIKFFRDGQLRLRDLSMPRLRAMLPTLEGLPGLEHDEDAALRDLVFAWGDGPLPPEVLRVWLMAARTPELAGVFARVARAPDALDQLRDQAMPALTDGRLTDTGFLLAMHLLDAAPSLPLEHPRSQALVHCHPLLKHTQRSRRLLSALAQLGRLNKHSLTEPVHKLLTWPDDAQLRPWMLAGCARARDAHLAALQALQAGTGDRAAARAAGEAVAMWTESLHLHADHLRGQGDRAAVQAYRECLRKDGLAQRAHLQRVAALLPVGSAGHGLAQAFLLAPSSAQEAAGKALNDWRKGLGKAPEATLATQVQAAASACLHRERRLRQLSKPVLSRPQAAPAPDFFTALAHHKAVQGVHHQHLVPLQVEALHALVSIHAFDGNTACHTPQSALAEKGRLLQVSSASEAAFDALVGRFRDPQLFWSFASRMRRYSNGHRAGFDTTLAHLLAGTQTEQRRGSPQMQALFAGGKRRALRDAWEAGAWSVVPKDQPYAGLRLHDTGAFEDFASSGDEIRGSCHSLLHGAYYQYLLGRVVCGSKRMLTIKDPTGRMVARAVFRLMLDSSDQPVLHMTRAYDVNQDRGRAAPVLRAFALQRAQALRLPLVEGRSGAADGSRPVHCKPGEFPEYWDEGQAGDAFLAPVVWEPEAR